MSQVLDKLHWRYATQKYDPSKRVADDVVARITEAVRLAPTSGGLQPFELFVVTDKAVRERLQVAARGQEQITDCSHVLVFAAWDDYTPQRIDRMFELQAEIRGTPPGWDAHRGMMIEMVKANGAEANFQNAARQAYIGLGMGLLAAAFEGVDSTPMEGFEPDVVDTILGLGERHLRSVVIMALGYREAESDWLVDQKKVRRSADEFITTVA